MVFSKIDGRKSLILTGSNGSVEYREMRKVLLNSIKANCPGQQVYDSTFDNLSRLGSALKRIDLFMDALDMGVEKIAWLDADIIVRKSLDEFWESVEPTTLSVLYRPDHAANFKFNTGVMAIGNSPATREMVEAWSGYCREHIEWTDDQKYLWKAYKKAPRNVRLNDLGIRYNDNHFDDDSVIWHGKGHSRKESAWKKESAKYGDA